MNKYYLEIREVISEEESFIRQPQAFIREVGGLQEAKVLYDEVKGLFDDLETTEQVLVTDTESKSARLVDVNSIGEEVIGDEEW